MKMKQTDNNMNGGEIMLGFILGSLFGGTVGVFTMALCSAAKRADEDLKKSKIDNSRIK